METTAPSSRYQWLIVVVFVIVAFVCGTAYVVVVMGKTVFIQALIHGLLSGSIYALLALGLALIFGVMKIINICHGELVVLGAYVTFWLYTLMGVDPFLSIPLSLLTLFIIGLPLGKFVMDPALKIGVDPPLIIAFGLSIILQNLMRYFWTATPRGIRLEWYLPINLPFGVTVSALTLIVALIAIFGLGFLHLFLKKTFIGKAIRAVSMDIPTSRLMGVNVENINALSYGIGLALAGISGSLIAVVMGFDPMSGMLFTNKALCVIVLGGVGHIFGAFVGGLVLGIAEAVGSFFLGDTARHAVAYILFLIVLIFKPTGLFAKYRAF